eukprot:157833_1
MSSDVTFEATVIAARPHFWYLQAHDSFGNPISGFPFTMSSTATWSSSDDGIEFARSPTFVQNFSVADGQDPSFRRVEAMPFIHGNYSVNFEVTRCSELDEPNCADPVTESAGFQPDSFGYTLIVIPSACGARDIATPFECLDGRCVASRSTCGDVALFTQIGASVCQNGDVLCNNNYCVSDALNCPPPQDCPPGQIQCATNECRTSVDVPFDRTVSDWLLNLFGRQHMRPTRLAQPVLQP